MMIWHGGAPNCCPVLNTQVGPMRSTHEPFLTKGDWCTWPDRTMSGRYCSIHSRSSTSPKYLSPPQLVGDLAGGAWWIQIQRLPRLAAASANRAAMHALHVCTSHPAH